MDPIEEMKREAALEAVKSVKDGMIVGLGTGSTANYAIREIGRLVREGNFSVRCVPTSIATENLAKSEGLELTNLDNRVPDITIDGADAIRKDFIVKGGGGAFTREKIVAYASKKFIVICDERKVVGENIRIGVPVEAIPFSLGLVMAKLLDYGSVEIRMNGKDRFITDNGNYVIDLYHQDKIRKEWESEIDSIIGVVANGIFTRKCDIIVGTKNGITKMKI